MNLHDVILAKAFGGGGGSGGSASIDVTASVGQTIVVEEVDANGKPTKWKAAEYQPRTHWRENAVLFDGVAEFDSNGEFIFMPTAPITEGETYKVTWNGVEYSCKAFEADGFVGLGNLTGETDEPFSIMYIDTVGGGAMSTDGATTATMTIEGLIYVPIPAQYLTNAGPYYITITNGETEEFPYICMDTVASVLEAYRAGRQLVVKQPLGECLYIPLVLAIVYGETVIFAFSANIGANNILFTLTAQEDGTFQVSDSLP